MALWDDIDEPVLRWVHALPPILEQERTYEMAIREPVECHDIPGLRSDDVHASLVRLLDHKLISAENTHHSAGARWYSLRVSVQGLVVLGEWPDLDRVASVASLQLLLQEFAEASETSEEKTALRRAVGAIGRIGEDIVKGTWTSVAGGVGSELSGGAPPTPPPESGSTA